MAKKLGICLVFFYYNYQENVFHCDEGSIHLSQPANEIKEKDEKGVIFSMISKKEG